MSNSTNIECWDMLRVKLRGTCLAVVAGLFSETTSQPWMPVISDSRERTLFFPTPLRGRPEYLAERIKRKYTFLQKISGKWEILQSKYQQEFYLNFPLCSNTYFLSKIWWKIFTQDSERGFWTLVPLSQPITDPYLFRVGTYKPMAGEDVAINSMSSSGLVINPSNTDLATL